MIRRRIALALLAIALVSPQFAPAQPPSTPAAEPQPPAQQPAQPATTQPAPPPGKVLFSRDADSTAASPTAPAQKLSVHSENNSLEVTDAERSALTFTAYDLDVHLKPASAAISARAALTVRNDGKAPLSRLVLEITSSMHWDAFSIAGRPLPFAIQPVDTDADHTGQTQEAVVTLPRPLAPDASLAFVALYSGAIAQSARRLERIGAPVDQAVAEDWDAIATDGTALRGFGNVVWYPVAEPPVFLGDGAKLFEAVGRAKLRQSAATVRLRLSVEYVGEPPDAAFFCGQRQQLTAISDNPNLPTADAPGIATAEFGAQPLGFRTLDLFVTAHPPTAIGTPANPSLISAVTEHDDALPTYKAAAALVEPLLTDWLGAEPQTFLTILDHPGQPFEDDTLLVQPIHAVDPAALASSLAHSLTHAWIHSNHAWIDAGLAQFVELLWTERTSGRAAALAQLQDAARSLALFEPEVPTPAELHPPDSAGPSGSFSSSSTDDATQTPASSPLPDRPAAASPSASPAGDSLVAATGEVFYRTKAASVWWMLRGIVGDQALKQALQAYRASPQLDRDPEGLQHTLEKLSHKDLGWFFDDWVYHDRGLPDLTIVNVTPSPLQSSSGLAEGWLVAVTVRNDGYAAAEVPVTVLSGDAKETQRLRIPGRSLASIRIVFAGTPNQVQVNDGSVPETRTSVHTRQIVLPQS